MTWKKVKLDILCKMNSGGTPSRKNLSFYSGDIPWAKISDIEAAEGGIVLNTEEHITNSGLAAINNRIFESGTLLLAMYGSVGKVAFTGKKMSTNQAILGINIKDVNILDYSYLKYWFQTIKSQLLDRAVGGTLQNISLGIVKELQIPLPPLSTQKRIAEILDAADALRRKDHELLKKYDELAQAIFIDMFGDPVKNEKGWDAKKLKDVCFKIADIDHKMPKEDENGMPFISAKDLKDDGTISFENVKKISEEDFNRLSKKIKPELNDIIYSRIGAKLGKARKVKTSISFIVSYSCCTIKPNKNLVNVDFLCYFLDSPFCLEEVWKKVRSIGVPDLGMDEVREIVIPIPPIKKQEEFCAAINFLETSKDNLRQELSINLFNSLIQKAFNGELL